MQTELMILHEKLNAGIIIYTRTSTYFIKHIHCKLILAKICTLRNKNFKVKEAL